MPKILKPKQITRLLLSLLVVGLSMVFVSPVAMAEEKSGSIGIEGRISSAPPTQGATISLPRNGQAFTELPVTVSGICPNDLLVKLFKNNVFAGSAQCTNGSFSIIVDLFNDQNELVARVYDALDQAGPDSNIVTVSFNDPRQGVGSRVSLTSNFAKRGANPGQLLTWPIILSGGTGPYAISVDWGDGKTPDLLSQSFPGVFNIQHTYDTPGVYNIIVRVTDKNGGVAFLQLVGVANGPLSQTTAAQNGDNNGGTKVETRILWQPAAFLLPFIISTFWLGKRHQLYVLRKRIERGDRPF